MYEPENQKNVIINEIERIKEDANIVIMSNLFSFIAAHPVNELVAHVTELIDWVKIIRNLKKNKH